MKHWTWAALAWAALTVDPVAQAPVTEPCLMTKLTAERGVAFARFGTYLAAQGDELVVASAKSETTGKQPGSIYCMRREGLHWYREAEIVPPAEVAYHFGVGLTVEGDTLVAGGSTDDGRILVYVYQRSAGVWSLRGLLDDLFFREARPRLAAIDGDRIAIGGPYDSSSASFGGSVRIYRETAAGWQLEKRLVPDDVRTFLRFGFALDFEDGRLVVGAPDNAPEMGTVYVYERRADEWVESAKIRVQDPLGAFGYSVSLDGDRLAVLSQGVAKRHVAYVFDHHAGTWVQTGRMVFERVENGFGESLDLLGDRLFASGLLRGHLFHRTAAGWKYEAALEAIEVEPSVRIDIAVATPDFAFLGCSTYMASDQRALEGGAVFAYSLTGTPCASLSVTEGWISYGKHELRLSRGPASAGHVYWLVGSMSGISPGIRVGGRRVPLNLDPYFRATVLGHNHVAFTNNFGRLDANGEATVRLDVPPDLLALFRDRNVDHAFLEFAQGKLVHVSNVAQARFYHRLK